jgi:flavin-binding protein dodecin
MTVARVTEISASSPVSFEDAVRVGIARASETLRNVRSAWVKEQQVTAKDGKVAEFRVNMMVTFVLEEAATPAARGAARARASAGPRTRAARQRRA